MNRIRIATLNSWSGINYKGKIRMGEFETRSRRDARFRGLLKSVLSEKYDVVALNELNLKEERYREFLYATKMQGCYNIGVSGIKLGGLGFPTNLCEADAIFATPELKFCHLGAKRLGGKGFASKWGSFHLGDRTQVVLSQIQFAGFWLYVAATHLHASPSMDWLQAGRLETLAQKLGNNSSEISHARSKISKSHQFRTNEIKRLVAFLQKKVPATAPLILMGDFNAEASWPEMQPIWDAGFKNLHAPFGGQLTWDATSNQNLIDYYLPDTKTPQKNLFETLYALDEMEPRQIDWILGRNIDPAWIKSGGLAFQDGKLNEGVEISDHFGLWLELET